MYLLSQDKTEVASVVEAMLPMGSPCEDYQDLSDVLYKNRLLHRLLEVQKSWNEVGFADSRYESPANEKSIAREATALGMSVRDCTLYVKVERQGGGTNPEIETRLGDLDPKPATPGNIDKWRSMELKLIGEGWYEANNGISPSYRCALER